MPRSWKFLINFSLLGAAVYLVLVLANFWMSRKAPVQKPEPTERLDQFQVKELQEKLLETAEELPPQIVKALLSSLVTGMQNYYLFNGEYPEKLTPDTLEELSGYVSTKAILKILKDNRIDGYRRGERNFEILVTTKGQVARRFRVDISGVHPMR